MNFRSESAPAGAIWVAVCTLGKVRIEHELVLANSAMPMGRVRMLTQITGHTTCDARNIAVEIARQNKGQYLMFWDDDVIPRDFQTLQKLTLVMDRFEDIDILGGVYPTRSDIPEPIVVKEEGQGAWWGWEDGKIHEVYMTGTGLTMFRVSSLEKMEIPTYDIVVDAEGNTEPLSLYFNAPDGMTDDVWFAGLAKQNGLSWGVCGDVRADQIRLEDGFLYRLEAGRVGVRA